MNLILALLSVFIPGLGQLLQGRIMAGITHFIVALIAWLICMGWIVHLFSGIDVLVHKK
jgi:TM2 domain-containing membrane protein YozV